MQWWNTYLCPECKTKLTPEADYDTDEEYYACTCCKKAFPIAKVEA